jgi:hypothetical protein
MNELSLYSKNVCCLSSAAYCLGPPIIAHDSASTNAMEYNCNNGFTPWPYLQSIKEASGAMPSDMMMYAWQIT